MADERDHWLDGDAAERLLRGEPLDAVDDHARVQAERLSAVLGDARRADPSQQPESARGPHPDGGELPGEAAALAAFRDARGAYATRVDDAPGTWVLGGRPGPGDTAGVLGDSGAVRIGTADGKPRTRWGRPVRYGLAAALAACTLGGVAMAGAGVIPTPFDRGPEPGPGASVSAAPSDPDPLLSPSPSTSASDPEGGHSGSATPDGATEGTPGSGHPSQGGGAPSDPGGTAPKPTDSALPKDDRARWYARVVTGCRDYLAGKPMDPEKKRRIEQSAGGPEGVRKFCRQALSGDGRNTDDRSGSGRDGDGGEDGDGGSGRGSEGGGDGSDGGNRHEGNGGAGAIVSPDSAVPASTAPSSATPTVSGTTRTATTRTATTRTATTRTAPSTVSTAGLDGTGNP
ncbi:hypothetical protein [Streptomyces luteolus]|uniref:Uncharacterized protein n=1 Tax=Streptomyces luteolus TaxID=3043615 RepID=A0ABT6T7Y1_9ACTN|nr:hypothetical protein [Streptomyces sp. B-S-A12]MDI3423785.1 hypothetical protein [Streptomyces sp. B-S-A12]